jgi:hypothetical protein
VAQAKISAKQVSGLNLSKEIENEKTFCIVTRRGCDRSLF